MRLYDLVRGLAGLRVLRDQALRILAFRFWYFSVATQGSAHLLKQKLLTHPKPSNPEP